MKKEYIYNPFNYKFRVTLVGVFCVFIIIYSIVNLVLLFLKGESLLSIWILGVVIATYAAWEIFVSGANPSKVTIDENSITFSSYGRDHIFYWNEIRKFKVKEFIGARKLFVRINEPSIFRGRYWVNAYYSNDTDELFKYIVDKEYELHPDSLKGKARRTGEEDLARRKRRIDQRDHRRAEAKKRGKEIIEEKKNESTNMNQ